MNVIFLIIFILAFFSFIISIYLVDNVHKIHVSDDILVSEDGNNKGFEISSINNKQKHQINNKLVPLWIAQERYLRMEEGKTLPESNDDKASNLEKKDIQNENKNSNQYVNSNKHLSSEGRQSTLEFLRYWNREPDPYADLSEAQGWEFPEPVKDSDRRYITFEDDTGGFNNMRMAFEVFVAVAKITGRILVLPPPCRYYLLDRGPIAIYQSKKGSYSTYSDYYDIDYLANHGNLKIITTNEFLKREAKNLNIPEDLVKEASVEFVDASNGHHTDYFYWLRKSNDGAIFPSGPQASPDTHFALNKPEELRNREPGLLLPNKVFIHFPMHVSQNLRYLDGVSELVKAAHPALSAKIRLFLRDNLHYREDPVMLAAAKIIDKLGGPGSYSSFHIRRNELQYKEVFVSASESINNVKNLLKPGETLYIATDETAPGFFHAFKKAGYNVRLLGDLLPGVPSLDSNYALSNNSKLASGADIGGYGHEFRGDGGNGLDVGGERKLLPKHIGLVEQVVAAAGRVFIGTSSSTFTSYIQRLRGYLGRTDKIRDLSCYYHNRFIELPSLENVPPIRCRGLVGHDASLWRRQRIEKESSII